MQQPKMEPNRQPETRKVPVVYYLCRNRQLEHPHYLEVSLVSPHGLYLRDVIERFDALRGRGLASMYSWSCKRNYKNAFVWNDLCEDDLIVPANGNEYVLKGSELVEEHDSGHLASARYMKSQNLKQLPEQHPSITRAECSFSANMNCKETKVYDDDDDDGCDRLTRYKIYKTNGLVDSSTQTEEYVKVKKPKERTTRLSVDNGVLESLYEDSPPSSPGASSFSGKMDTLESLMKADGSKLNSSERLVDREYKNPTNTKLRASNKLLQLISCGSVSGQDHDFGRSLSCRSSSLNSKVMSRLRSSSVILKELDCLSENDRFVDVKLEDKQYFSGSLMETKSLKKEDFGSLKRSSSYTANRVSKCDSRLTRKNCIPRSIKGSLIKHPRSQSMRLPEGPNSCTLSPCLSNNSSKRITTAKKQTKRTESFNDDKENVMKIEERLASGARVIIHLKANDSLLTS
uniref:protein SOSEKI 3-like n=1 Tax=Erigeron canadensis TaxID=72917 RepID=UPI001CB99E07|nr:protein SOSEKI 3-like [Erigeron canadensis]